MTDSLPNQKKLVLISEAAKILGVSIDTVRRWDKSGVLHSERPDGKNRYFSLDELEKHKTSQPLSISQAAKNLGISPVTLRRLEDKGLIKPERNTAGERVYDKESIKNFQDSAYFLRKKQIKETIVEPSREESENIPPESFESFEKISFKPNLKPHSRIHELAVSVAVFALLVTLGIGNIKLTEAKNLQLVAIPAPTSAVLSETTELSTAPDPVSTAPEAVSTAPAETVSTPSAEIVEPKKILTIKIDGSDSVIIRQKPTTDAKIISLAKDGDTFEFISLNSDWYEVKLADGSIGFISAGYIEMEETNK